MILITGGRGAVATGLLGLLHAHGRPLRVASADPAKLALPDGVASVPLDLTDPATFPAALSGITEVFLYATAEHIGEFVDQAVKAEVAHVVILSSAAVLGPDPEHNPVAKSHLDVEEALLASPIPTTILRPGSFAGNAAGWAWAVRSGQPISLPYPNSCNDPIHEADIAEAAYAVLTDPAHRGGQFHLTGPQAMTFAEQIDQLAGVLGRPIAVNHVTRQQWKQEMAEHIPGPFADALLDWWASNDGKPVELTTAVQDLTGHPARTFATWAGDHIDDFKS
jgi:uncharacterized protein YbjT (DUF2867 family)